MSTRMSLGMLSMLLSIIVSFQAQAQGPLAERIMTDINWDSQSTGCMFDVTALNDVTLCALNLAYRRRGGSVVETVAVYAVTGGGSYVGNETNSSAWTLVGSAYAVDGQTNREAHGSRVLRIPNIFTTPIGIPMGVTQGFYVTYTLMPSLRDFAMLNRQMPSPASVIAQDANLQIHQGIGISYPFGAIDTQRAFCGGFDYEVGLGPCTLTRPPLPYKTNVAYSALSWPEVGVVSAFTPRHLKSVPGVTERLNLISAGVGAPWDLGISVGRSPSWLQNGISTAGGQAVNVDLYNSNTVMLNGGTVPDLTTTSFPSNSWEIPIPINGFGVLSAQMVNVDPTSAEGFSLSHAVELTTQPLSFIESFEDVPLYQINALPPGWHNLGPNRWTIWTGQSHRRLLGAPTGPANGALVGRFYLIAQKYFSAYQQETFIVETCPYPVSNLTSNTLSFALNREGAGVGDLTVSVSDGSGGQIALATYSGPANVVGWTNETLSFTPTGTEVTFQLRYTNAGGGEANLAIDEFLVQ